MEINNSVPGVLCSAPSSNNYEPACPIGMINKALDLAMAWASTSGIPLLLASTAREAYNEVDIDYHGQDFSVVYQ
jgi:3-hydroxyisobutyrate dehydrogenase-like beta-hydroxyacid dehydrogenase